MRKSTSSAEVMLNSEKVKPELCLSKGIQQLVVENSTLCSDSLKALCIDLKAYCGFI